MKLLLVTKRRFMTKDVVLEEYGRQYELAARLATAGWDIKAYCLDYRSICDMESNHSGGIEWHSYSAPLLLIKWNSHIKNAIRSWKPDIVLGCSDPLHISAAYIASNEGSTQFAVDLHDNLDSKGMMRIPGFRRRVGKAIAFAQLVSCVSQPLSEKVKSEYQPRGTILVLESAIPDEFAEGHLNKESSRRYYGLQEYDQIIGVAGALYRQRGIDTVLEGFGLLQKENPRLALMLAGPTDKSRTSFKQKGVHYFGNLDWKSIPGFMSSFDIGIVPNIRPLFADYCYPQKAVELCSLSIPIVAATLGVMKTMAAGFEQILYQPDDPVDFARAVKYQLEYRTILNVEIRNWAQQAEVLNRSLLQILH